MCLYTNKLCFFKKSYFKQALSNVLLPITLALGASTACGGGARVRPLPALALYWPNFSSNISSLLSLECFDSLGVFFPVDIFSIPKTFKQTQRGKLGCFTLKLFPCHLMKVVTLGGGGTGGSYQASGEVWGFLALPGSSPLLSHSTCPAGSQVTRCDCMQQSGRPFSLLVTNPHTSSLPPVSSCCTEFGCWFPFCLLPSPAQAGPTHILEALTRSINKHVLSSSLVRSMVEPWATETGKALPCSCKSLEVQVSMPPLFLFWGQCFQGKPSLKVLGTLGWAKGKFGIRRDNEVGDTEREELDEFRVGKMSQEKKSQYIHQIVNQ